MARTKATTAMGTVGLWLVVLMDRAGDRLQREHRTLADVIAGWTVVTLVTAIGWAVDTTLKWRERPMKSSQLTTSGRHACVRQEH